MDVGVCWVLGWFSDGLYDWGSVWCVPGVGCGVVGSAGWGCLKGVCEGGVCVCVIWLLRGCVWSGAVKHGIRM